jgi:hypothetical protein
LIELGPHRTHVLNLKPLLPGPDSGRASRLTVVHGGAPGDVLVAGTVTTPGGYSANVRFLDAKQLDATELFSPVFPWDRPLSPIAILSNTTSIEFSVTIEAYYTINGKPAETTLYTVAVPPSGVVHAKLEQYMGAIPAAAENLGLTFEYESRTGGLISDLLAMDSSGSEALQVSPKGTGYGQHAHAYHSFPFRIAERVDTFVTVANPSDITSATYALVLYYDGKSYTSAERSLSPGEVRHLSIKDLRDNQIPGFLGVKHTIRNDEHAYYSRFDGCFRVRGRSGHHD